MSPHALRQRMKHGNVYPPDRAEIALERFFTEANLTALRELAPPARRRAGRGPARGVARRREPAARDRPGRGARRRVARRRSGRSGGRRRSRPRSGRRSWRSSSRRRARDGRTFDASRDLQEAIDDAVDLGAGRRPDRGDRRGGGLAIDRRATAGHPCLRPVPRGQRAAPDPGAVARRARCSSACRTSRSTRSARRHDPTAGDAAPGRAYWPRSRARTAAPPPTSSRNSGPSRTSSDPSVVAVTVALRGAPLSRPSSPKNASGPSVRSCRSRPSASRWRDGERARAGRGRSGPRARPGGRRPGRRRPGSSGAGRAPLDRRRADPGEERILDDADQGRLRLGRGPGGSRPIEPQAEDRRTDEDQAGRGEDPDPERAHEDRQRRASRRPRRASRRSSAARPRGRGRHPAGRAGGAS